MTDSEPMEPAAPDAPSNNGKFQPGRSGNPKGRPRKANTVGASVRDALAAKVTINEGGKRRRITLADATAKQWANKGASGDLRAGKLAFDMAAKAEEREAQCVTAPSVLTASDKEIVARLVTRLALIQKEMADEPDHA